MKYLVTGGFGFIGTNLVVELLNQGHHVVVIDDCSSDSVSSPQWSDKCDFIQCDIAKPNFYHKFLDGVDTCFHLAAKARVQPSIEDPARFDFTNVHGTVQLFKACVDAGVKKIVFSSSSSVYGDAVELPMTESHPFNNKNFYGASKIAGEAMCTAFNDRYGLEVIGLRYMNVYGPHQDQTAAYTGVIPIMLNKIEANESPVINGDGSQAYDFIYVEDAARCNVKALKSEIKHGFYNVVLTYLNFHC